MMKIKIVATNKGNGVISRHIHSVFFEYFGHVIYDGIWVGGESSIPNIDGLRKDVVDGCKELGIGAMRWPGGCCADHYHWKNGVGKERPVDIILNYLSYYGGQFLIASSLLLLK